MTRITTALVLCVLASPLASAQRRGGPPETPVPGAADQAPRVEYAGPAEEKISQTSHTVRLDGHDIKYTATAGTLPIRARQRAGGRAHVLRRLHEGRRGREDASRVVSLQRRDRARRRSGCTWDRSREARRDGRRGGGVFSRRRRTDWSTMRTRSSTRPDMIFVDAIDTGFSRVVSGVNNQQFHGRPRRFARVR